jgi:hypothetical protein
MSTISDEEMTAAMRRFHQQRRDSILKMLEEKHKSDEKTEENEIKSLVNLNEMTLRMMAGVTTCLPVFIPLQTTVSLEEE